MTAYVRYRQGGQGYQEVSEFTTVAIDDQVIFSGFYRNTGWIPNQLPLKTIEYTVGLSTFRFYSTPAPATGTDATPDEQAHEPLRPLSWTESKLQFLNGAVVVAEFLFQAVRGWSNLPPGEDSELDAWYVKYRGGAGYQGCVGADNFLRTNLDIYSGYYRDTGWVPNQEPLFSGEFLVGVTPQYLISNPGIATGTTAVPDEQAGVAPRYATWKETMLVFRDAADVVIGQFLESQVVGWSDTPPQ